MRSSNLCKPLTALFFLLVATTLRSQVATEAGGVVTFDAENFTTNLSPKTPVGGVPHSWTLNTAVTGYEGTGYMEATPNSGPPSGNADANSPQLQFTVNFTSTGTHYVWIRGNADTNNDDSLFAGIDGTAGNIASSLSGTYPTGWQWSNAPQSGSAAPTVNVPSTGNHTVNIWMREDGLRVDRVILTTATTFTPTLGNAWHIPNSAEATGGATMRSPLTPTAGSPVTIYNGSQFQGPGNPGDQLQTGSTVFYKKIGDSTWSSVAMTFSSQGTGGTVNNKYYAGIIPAAAFNAGDTIQYYIKVPFREHLPTFLFGSDSLSHTAENEADAQANPFVFTAAPALQPTGNYLSFDSGNFEARIYQDTGHVALAEPDLNGSPLANAIVIAPATVKTADRTYIVGPVTSSSPIPNGLQLVQTVGNSSVTSQLTFKSDGVLHYEVTNWNGFSPTETDFSSASDASEHFYGFGEKFNSFDQAGNKVHIMTNDQGGTKGDFTYKSSPWFISTRGYGLHLDSTAESYFDMRNGAADRFTIQNLFGTLKFNLVGGPKLTDVLTRYTGYTGRPYLPPPWVFGTWVSSDIWRTGGEVRYAITKYRTSGIPISVFVFDSPWEVSYNDFIWNMTQFAAGGTYEGVGYNGFNSLGEMMTFFQQNGVKVVCWFTPFINTSSFNDNVGGATPGQNTGKSPNYDTAASAGYFVKTSISNSAPLDGELVERNWKPDRLHQPGGKKLVHLDAAATPGRREQSRDGKFIHGTSDRRVQDG